MTSDEQKPFIYTCANCGEEFESGWSNEEAMEEYKKNFPWSAELRVETDLVCDDCYKKMMEDFNN